MSFSKEVAVPFVPSGSCEELCSKALMGVLEMLQGHMAQKKARDLQDSLEL